MFELVTHIPLILAQAAPHVEPTTVTNPIAAFYELLLHNGLMGGAVALLIYLLIKRDNDLQKSQEGRLADAKVLADIVKEHTTALVTSNAAGEERNRALEVSSRAAEKSAIIIDQMTKEIAELKTELRTKVK